MKKILLLILFLLIGISFNVKAETSEEIYNKLLQDCNELKSKNFVSADCEMLNLPNLQLTVKNGLYEANAAGIASEYSKIVNDLNTATLFGDYAKICEALKEKSRTYKGNFCGELYDGNKGYVDESFIFEHRDCWKADLKILKIEINQCLNHIIPVTKNCKIWFEDASTIKSQIVLDERGKEIKDKKGDYIFKDAPYYAMKLNKNGITNLFIERNLTPPEIKENEIALHIERCGSKIFKHDKSGYMYRFPAKPYLGGDGVALVAVHNFFKELHNTVGYIDHAIDDDRDYLDWVENCFDEIVGDKAKNLKQDENGCWY